VHCPVDETKGGVWKHPLSVQFPCNFISEHMVSNGISWVPCDLDAPNNTPNALSMDVVGDCMWWVGGIEAIKCFLEEELSIVISEAVQLFKGGEVLERNDLVLMAIYLHHLDGDR
jgi:hypothetical protein